MGKISLCKYSCSRHTCLYLGFFPRPSSSLLLSLARNIGYCSLSLRLGLFGPKGWAWSWWGQLGKMERYRLDVLKHSQVQQLILLRGGLGLALRLTLASCLMPLRLSVFASSDDCLGVPLRLLFDVGNLEVLSLRTPGSLPFPSQGYDLGSSWWTPPVGFHHGWNDHVRLLGACSRQYFSLPWGIDKFLPYVGPSTLFWDERSVFRALMELLGLLGSSESSDSISKYWRPW